MCCDLSHPASGLRQEERHSHPTFPTAPRRTYNSQQTQQPRESSHSTPMGPRISGLLPLFPLFSLLPKAIAPNSHICVNLNRVAVFSESCTRKDEWVGAGEIVSAEKEALFSQRTRVLFPAINSGSLQMPATPTLEESSNSGLPRHLPSCVYTPFPMHII